MQLLCYLRVEGQPRSAATSMANATRVLCANRQLQALLAKFFYAIRYFDKSLRGRL